jgi:hypothetical protein
VLILITDCDSAAESALKIVGNMFFFFLTGTSLVDESYIMAASTGVSMLT